MDIRGISHKYSPRSDQKTTLGAGRLLDFDKPLYISCPSPRWSAIVSFPPSLEGCRTKFAPHKTLNLIAHGKLNLDESVVHHSAVCVGAGARKQRLECRRDECKCGRTGPFIQPSGVKRVWSFGQMASGSNEVSYLFLIDLCITHL